MKIRHLGLGLLAATGVAALAAAPSFAQGTFYVVTETNRLGTVSVTDGSYTDIGALGTQLTDIAVASDGSLYGVSFNNLYSISNTTGAASLIGATGVTHVNALVFSNNTLYAARYEGTGATGNTPTDNPTFLYTLSTTTGAATIVGNGINNLGAGSAGDLAFDNKGNLYLSSIGNHLIRINSATGAGTDVGAFGGSFSSMYGLAFQPSSLTLYGYSYDANQIVTVNTSTGAATAVANNQGPRFFGTAFIGEASVNAPEPGTFPLALVGLSALGLLRRRRRRA